MDWIRIEDQLPPKNTLVWVKRLPNRREQEPICLAMRNDRELSINTDVSRNCHWYGINNKLLLNEQESCDKLKLNDNFSDITVKEWKFVECI